MDHQVSCYNCKNPLIDYEIYLLVMFFDLKFGKIRSIKYNSITIGTGKTKTLVAAIEQIVRTTRKKILVCAMSNAACDEITERLLNGPTKQKIYRLYAVSFNTDNISSSIKQACNLSGEKLYKPELSTLYQYQVLICTLSTASCMSVTNADSMVYRADHFQYVFIDECASSHETMTLIPICGRHFNFF